MIGDGALGHWQYVITDPFTGEQLTQPGWNLRVLIKAATERVWNAEAVVAQPPSAPAPLPGSESLNIAHRQ